MSSKRPRCDHGGASTAVQYLQEQRPCPLDIGDPTPPGQLGRVREHEQVNKRAVSSRIERLFPPYNRRLRRDDALREPSEISDENHPVCP